MAATHEIPRKTSAQIDFGPYGEKLKKQIGAHLRNTPGDQAFFDFSQPILNELFSGVVEQGLVVAIPVGGTATMKDLTGELGKGELAVATVFQIASRAVGKFDAGVSLRLGNTGKHGLDLVDYKIEVPSKKVDPRRAGIRKLIETGVKAADVNSLLTTQVDEQLIPDVKEWGVQDVTIVDNELHTVFERSS